MKNLKTYFVLSSVFLFNFLYSQNQNKDTLEYLKNKTFFSIEEANKTPLYVYKLDLSYNDLKSVPEEIFNFKNIEYLNISGNFFERLPENFSKLYKIKILKLSSIRFLDAADLFDKISGLKNLEHLDISNCNIDYVPVYISELSNLCKINLSDNNISYLPYEIYLLKNLSYLDLSKNNLDFETELALNESIKYLDISYNPGLGSLKVLEYLKNSSNLDTLVFKAANAIPDNLQNISQIKYFDVSESSLKNIPKSIRKLDTLETLILNNCKDIDYSKLFSKISYLKNIKNIEIRDDNISSIPVGIGRLKTTENLSFCGKELKYIPEDMYNMKKLKALEIKIAPKIEIEYTFNIVKSIDSLETLSINYCQLDSVPESISKLKTVKKIDLNGNNIVSVNKSIEKLKNLDILNLQSNPLNNCSYSELKQMLPNCNIICDNYDQQKTKEVRLIKKPVINLDVEEEVKLIDPQKESTFKFTTGSEIKIPDNAFLDKNGNVYTDEVKIKYKEYRDPIDYFVSGIPLQYDSAGITYNFMSAGMFEFTATTENGDKLYPNLKNKVLINFLSKNPENNMGFYYFDTLKGNWNYISKDSSKQKTKIITTNNSTQNLYRVPPFSKTKIEATMFIAMPEKINKNSIIFSFRKSSNITRQYRKNKNMFIKDHKEYSVITSNKWVYEGSDCKQVYDAIKSNFRNVYTKRKFLIFNYTTKKIQEKVPIKDFTINPNFEADKYLLTFKINDKEFNLKLYVDVNSNNPDLIQKTNSKIFSDYNDIKSKQLKNWKKIDSCYEDEYKKYQISIQEIIEKNKLILKKDIEQNKLSVASGNNITRSFFLEGFGTFNCDIIKRMQDPKPLLAMFIDSDNKKIIPKSISIINLTNPGIISYKGSELITFDAGSINLMIVTLYGNKLGYLKKDEMFYISLNKSANQTIMLHTIDSNNTTVEDLRKQLDAY